MFLKTRYTTYIQLCAKKALLRALLAAISLLTTPLILAQQEIGGSKLLNEDEKMYVFIVSSYGYEQEWSTQIAYNIRNALEKEYSQATVRIDYLGAERRKSFLATRYGFQSVFYNYPKKPDVMIFIGDEAWMTYRVMSLRGWEVVPVILCDVSDYIMKDYISFFEHWQIAGNDMLPIQHSSDLVNFTGVLRKNNAQQKVALIDKLIPDLNRIVYISEDNYADIRLGKEIEQAVHANYDGVAFDWVHDYGANTDSIYTALTQLSQNSAVIANQWYSVKFKKSLKEDGELNELLNRKMKAPIFTLKDVQPTDSLTVGGYYVPSSTYAEQIVNLTEQILNGKNPKEIPMVYANNTVVLNQTALHHLEIRNADGIPHATYVNLVPDALTRYRNVIWVCLVILIIAGITAIVLWKNREYRAKIQGSLIRYRNLYEEFMVVYENMPAGLVLCDSEGNILRENPGAEKIRSQIKGNTDINNILRMDFFPEEVKQSIIAREQIISRISHREKLANGEYTTFYFRITVQYIKDQIGNNSDNILIILVDISEARKEKLEREKINNIFEFAMKESELGVAENNILTEHRYATQAWYNNLLIDCNDPDEEIYQNVHPEDLKKINQYIEGVKKGSTQPFSGSIRILHNDMIHWLQYVIIVREYSPESGRIVLAELSLNIDKQKLREKELEVALKRSKELELLKNGFITNMSHEIITPLNSIVTFSEAICNSKEPEQKRTLVEHLEKNNEILLKVIADIIDLSKIESDTAEFKFAETDMRGIVAEVSEMIRYEVDTQKVEVITEEKGNTFLIIADKLRLIQILKNFASNAVNFTTKGFIKIGYEVEGNILCMYVEDSGRGISKDKEEYIFQRFINDDSHEVRGHGLGLPIAKSIVAKLDGEIGFESKLGTGSKFWCKIPVKAIVKEVEEGIAKQVISSRSIRQKKKQPFKILVAEDNESNFLLIEHILKNKYELHHAWDGLEAISMFREVSPSLILMDIKMPIMDGYMATQKIRELSTEVPIIAVTAHAFSKDEQRVMTSGFNGYLAKPINNEKLITLLDEWEDKLY